VRSSTKFLLPTVAASLALAACGSSSSSSGNASSSSPAAASSGSASGPTVKTATNSKIGGTILVNAAGMTLYRLRGEHVGKFICTSTACLASWHPLMVSGGGTLSGVAGLGTVARPGGTEQVAYKGQPLYTFAADKAPGQANGQGFKDVGTWNAVTTGASSGAAPPASSSSSSSAYGY
jgi:predicted lipoprotein with Yx(FWY)xxD motif